MHTRILYSIVVAVVALACSSADSGPTSPAPRLGLGNDPDRIRVRDQRREPFSLIVIGCLNEPLVVTGMANSIVQAQDNPAGNAHFRLHTNLQGVSGVGAVTGTQYILAQVHNSAYNYDAAEPPRFETNQVFRYRLIGDRPNNNFWLNISYHVTVTPDGRISRTSFEADSRCFEDG